MVKPKEVIEKIKKYYAHHPLNTILFAGLFFRLLAVIFSKGYGWHDDQFLIIEIAQSWVDGIDYYSWLPSADGTNPPEGFSFFYVGIHYLLFSFFNAIGFTDPQGKMYIIRLIHGLWSILVIYFGYKITLKLGNQKSAKQVGWLLSLLWLFPMISVRNLVEFACVPLLLWGLWLIVNNTENKSGIFLWAGILMGLAFNIRFQSLILTGGIGLAMLFHKQWKETFLVAAGILLSIIIFQGSIDYFVWGSPFVQVIEYINYNMHHAAEYIVSPWYTYIIVLAGLLVPPVSLFLLAGFFQQWRKLLIIFLPVIIFIIFHSYYPNKQERFIITAIPMLIIAGIIGWNEITEKIKSREWKKIISGCWVFFWVINTIALLPITVMYSKQARVESMCYLSQYGDINNFVIEDINQSVLRFPPQYYLQNWYNYQTFMREDNLDKFRKYNQSLPLSEQPGFLLFYQPNNIEKRVENMKTVYPDIVFETTIEPGFMDKVLHWLNPINDNQRIYIYRNPNIIKKKITE